MKEFYDIRGFIKQSKRTNFTYNLILSDLTRWRILVQQIHFAYYSGSSVSSHFHDHLLNVVHIHESWSFWEKSETEEKWISNNKIAYWDNYLPTIILSSSDFLFLGLRLYFSVTMTGFDVFFLFCWWAKNPIQKKAQSKNHSCNGRVNQNDQYNYDQYFQWFHIGTTTDSYWLIFLTASKLARSGPTSDIIVVVVAVVVVGTFPFYIKICSY